MLGLKRSRNQKSGDLLWIFVSFHPRNYLSHKDCLWCSSTDEETRHQEVNLDAQGYLGSRVKDAGFIGRLVDRLSHALHQ